MSHILPGFSAITGLDAITEATTRATDIGKTSVLPLIGTAIGSLFGPVGAAAGNAIGTTYSDVGNGGSTTGALEHGALSGATTYVGSGIASGLGDGVGSALDDGEAYLGGSGSFGADIGGALDDAESSLGGSGSFGDDLGLNSIGKGISGIFGGGDSPSTSAINSDGTLESGGGANLSGNGASTNNTLAPLTAQNSGGGLTAGGGASSYAGSAGSPGSVGSGIYGNSPILGAESSTGAPAAGSTYTTIGGASPGAASSVGNGIYSGDPILGGATSTATGGATMPTTSNILSSALKIGGGLNSILASNQAQKDLVAQQRQSQAELQPFLTNGTAASNSLAQALGIGGNSSASNYGSLTTPFTAANLASDPGYQFDLQQGTNALTNSQAAKGGLLSGAAQEQLADYSQGLADTTYNEAFNRNLQQNQATYNDLSGVSNTGQQAANTLSGINNNIGLAQANNATTNANIINGTASSLVNGGGNTIIGYKSDGTPIYANGNNNSSIGNTLAKLLGVG